jgi:hypothetical protein
MGIGGLLASGKALAVLGGIALMVLSVPFLLGAFLIPLQVNPNQPFPAQCGSMSTPTASSQTSVSVPSPTATPLSANAPACQAVKWALLMSAHLHGNPPCLQCSPDTYYDSGFPSAIVDGQFQCVVYVLAAYAYVTDSHGHYLRFPEAGNADQWWGEYATIPGYQEIGAAAAPPSMRGLPAPGDVMAWSGGANGHVTIVLSVTPPVAGHAGSVTFGNANGQYPIQTLPLLPDLTVNTANGYWNGFTVEGYIRLIPPKA